MKYSLYTASAADDKRSAFSWLLADYKGVVASGIYLTQGERRFDESYCGHIALQRALRAASRQEGVIQLRVVMDETVSDSIGYELLNVSPPLYPSLCRTTQRVLKRFDRYELAAFKKDEADASPQEIAVMDDAIDALDQAQSLAGTFRYYRDCVVRPNKIIR